MEKNQEKDNVIKFISLLSDMTIKTLYVKGSYDSKIYLNRIISNIVGYDVGNFSLSTNELGLSTYKSIANKVDILLVNRDKRKKINIELNKKFSEYLRRKNDTYLYKLAGDTYAGLKKEEKYNFDIDILQININNYYNKENKNISINSYILADPVNNLVKEGIKIHDIYLPKITEICYDGSSELYKDLAMFKANSYEDMEKLVRGNKEREAVMDDLKKLGSDQEFVDLYDHEEFQEIMLKNEVEAARREGHMNGIAEGFVEGKSSIIKKLLNKGNTIDEISKMLDIDVDELNKIVK